MFTDYRVSQRCEVPMQHGASRWVRCVRNIDGYKFGLGSLLLHPKEQHRDIGRGFPGQSHPEDTASRHVSFRLDDVFWNDCSHAGLLLQAWLPHGVHVPRTCHPYSCDHPYHHPCALPFESYVYFRGKKILNFPLNQSWGGSKTWCSMFRWGWATLIEQPPNV